MKSGLDIGKSGGALALLRRVATAGAVNVASAVLLLALFLVSWYSLASFPDSFADEGSYGEAGFSLVTTGRFTPYDVIDGPAFRLGDGLRPHAVGALFGYVGKQFGYSLRTARTISFVMVWVAVLLWVPITKSFGLPPWLGALLFASSERVFWASHVFRPEATLVLVNTVLVFALVRGGSGEASIPYWVGRGLLNGALVLAHGNGLVSAIINSVEALASCARRAWRVRAVRLAAYAAGGLLAVGAFYLIQVRPIGGWRVFLDQFAAAKQYLPREGVLGTVRRDLERRWGRELLVVGASLTGKILRGVWYATVLAATLWSALGPAGLARRLAVVGLGTVFGYTFLVHDRATIHIAEMIPFLCAAFLAWLGSTAPEWARRSAAAVLVMTGLSLCFHHGIKYRPYRTEPELTCAAIRGYLETRAARSQPPVRAVVGAASLWFWLKDVVPVVPRDRGLEGKTLDGNLIVACDPALLPWLERCSLEYSDPDRRFAAYACPAVAPTPR